MVRDDCVAEATPSSALTDRATLAQAARFAPLANAERLRRAREAHGWTQSELVQRMEPAVSTAAISQLETGNTIPSAATLAAISEATGFPLGYFVRHHDDADATAFFRSLRSTPARERKRALAWAHLLNDFTDALEEHVQLPAPAVPRFEADRHTDDEIDDIAAAIRGHWALGTGPITHVVLELERHGCVVARLPLERHDLDAFSVWFPERPLAILGRDKLVMARSRFDTAHELGHLVLHPPEVAGSKVAESEAHRFAAAFLMPADSMVDKLPSKPDWRRLLSLKVEWGVSLQALLMRARTMGILPEHRYVSALKQMSARGWRRTEPGDDQMGPVEEPRLLDKAIETIARSGTDLATLCREAALPLQQIESMLAVTGDRRPMLDL